MIIHRRDAAKEGEVTLQSEDEMTIFKPDQVYCVFDYETFSEAPLKKVGGFEYSVHPSTDIMCAAWRIGTSDTLANAPTQHWAPKRAVSHPRNLQCGRAFQRLIDALLDPSVVIVAHNAYFEQVITRNVLARMIAKDALRHIPPSRWLCTASLAAALALPRNLEGAAKALKLGAQKDMAGHKLMLKWAKPRKPTKYDPRTRHDDQGEYEKIVGYCIADIDAEVALFLKLPGLTRQERKVWELDQAINLRGFQVDRPLVGTILAMIANETEELNRETLAMTGGAIASANERASVKDWLESEGVFLPNMQKKTIEDALATNLVSGEPKRMLEIRQAISKTSTAKYQAFELRSRHDGRVRDILVYHAASTGRWGGAGVQPQNFPRGTISDTRQLAQVIARGDLELVRMVYGDPMSAFSSALRGMIIAPRGRVFDVADYSAIEARVLFWVADHTAGLQAYRDKRDLYCELASVVFGREITKEDTKERFLGKEGTLGAGYGLGWKKFQASCKTKGQNVSDDTAQAVISAYRTTHKPVTVLWKNIERAAVAAVQNPGKKYTISHTSWWIRGDFLWCQLPSGRRLAYHRPTVRYEPSPWGDKRPVLYHWGIGEQNRQWVNQKTYGGRLVENIVQAIARDLMAEAMLRIDAAGPWDLVLSVHDELVGERDGFGPATHEDFMRLMVELPEWAGGIPITAEGWEGHRYRK